MMAHALCCSIEMEPRTLNELQLNDAREAAIDIVKKQKSNEASNIFIEGLRPVLSIKVMEEEEEEEEQQKPVVECKEKISSSSSTTTITTTAAPPQSVIDERKPCDYCACNSTITIDESPHDNFNKIREPLSAPF
ncbi:hypothetical protein BVC80_209g297 [Macleaya cordata]|uniref:Uncharacterized protein n=1 Tax=Macleaya cordata TaxID=56857 RepID=A0A200QDM4_MACCD|nr:hypothetical protein BVC80_209g297 [Macleaya cordata]